MKQFARIASTREVGKIAMQGEHLVRDDRLLLVTRSLSAIIVPFLLAAFGVLYLLPEHTGELFAWNIQPRMTSMMLGEAYLAGAYFFVRAILTPRWHRVAVGFIPVTTFATLMGISTILHWDRFNHSSVAFWTWVALYFTTPFLVPVVWWSNRRTDPGTPEARDLLVPTWMRQIIGTLGAGAVLIGLLFFLQPNLMMGAWPWKLTLLTARVMGTLFALTGVGAICIALDERWSAVRIAFQSQMIALVLVVLAIVFSWGNFHQANPLTWVFVAGMLFLLVVSPAFYLWMERSRRVLASDSTHRHRPVPFIKGEPIVGNLLEFVRDRLSLLQSILVEHADDFDKGDLIHNVFRPRIGDSIFSSEGDFHNRQRELMDPSFQPHTIANYAESAGGLCPHHGARQKERESLSHHCRW